MQINGLQPNGAHPHENGPGKLKSAQGIRKEAPGTGKAESPEGGNSFAAALGKAKAAAQAPAQAPASAPPQAGLPSQASENAPPPEMGSHIDLIRLRLQSGYYNSQKVDEALSDKLSGFFDDAV